MKDLWMNIYEIVIGGILMGAALLYLQKQYCVTQALTETVTMRIIDNQEIYPQYENYSQGIMSRDEVIAMLIGYREFPVYVDGYVIPVNVHDYELYFSHIKGQVYEKSYIYDEAHQIKEIVFTSILL